MFLFVLLLHFKYVSTCLSSFAEPELFDDDSILVDEEFIFQCIRYILYRFFIFFILVGLERIEQQSFDLIKHIRILFKILLDVLSSLSDPVAVKALP